MARRLYVELTIEHAKAIALGEDNAHLENDWFERDPWSHQPQNLPSILTRDHVSNRD